MTRHFNSKSLNPRPNKPINPRDKELRPDEFPWRDTYNATRPATLLKKNELGETINPMQDPALQPVRAFQNKRTYKFESGLLQSYIEQVLRTDPSYQKKLLIRLQHFIHLNSNADHLPLESVKTFNNFMEMIDSDEWFSSYPTYELVGVAYIKTFHAEILSRMIKDLENTVSPLDENAHYYEVTVRVDSAINSLLKQVVTDPDQRKEIFQNPEREQIFQELRFNVYHALLMRDSTPERHIRVSWTASRDGQQSNFNLMMKGWHQATIIRFIVRFLSGVFEGWGGGVVQAAMLIEKHGDTPEDPWTNLRLQMRVLKEELDFASWGRQKAFVGRTSK